MAQDTISKCLGLTTQYNPLNVAPGALKKANNCVILRENVLEDRRGYALYGTVPASFGPVTPVTQLFNGFNKVFAHHTNAIAVDDGTGVFNDLGAPANVQVSAGRKMRSIEAFKNVYITTTKGVQVITSDDFLLSPRIAGSPRSYDSVYVLNAAATGFLATASQCAYRTVIQKTDTNANVLYGYPSSRTWVVNTSGVSKNVDLTTYLPPSPFLSPGDIVQVYRTAQVLNPAPMADISADEMALVYQHKLTAPDIAARSFTFTDSTTDALRGASLYTSPSQEGLAQANQQPPLPLDLAVYQSVFNMYANTVTKQRLLFSLVGTTSLIPDSLIIGDLTIAFGAVEGPGVVGVSTTGIAAVDIDLTARSLVRVINLHPAGGGSRFSAYYLSGPDDLPGQILLEEVKVGGLELSGGFPLPGFIQIQAVGTPLFQSMFFPPPPINPATSPESISTNDAQKNAVFYSKAQQPEAVPLLNYVLVGSANKEILRIIALKASLIIIKEDGVYALTGDSPQSFIVTPVDLTVICKAADSVVSLANQVFMLSNQGVVAITENGVQIVSREIETDIKKLIPLANLSANTCGCGYESDKQYMLSTVTSAADTMPSQTYVFNYATRTWVRWTYAWNAAIVDSTTDKLFLSKKDLPDVYRERKDFSGLDYADPDYPIGYLGSPAPLTVNFTMPLGVTPQIGWAILSPDGGFMTIASVVLTAPSTFQAVVNYLVIGLDVGPARIYPPVGMEFAYQDWYGGQPGIIKQAREVALLGENIPEYGTELTFYTDLSTEEESVAVQSLVGAGWGSTWGSEPWGDPIGNSAYRTYVPRAKQFHRTLTFGARHLGALEKLTVLGTRFSFEMISENVTK